MGYGRLPKKIAAFVPKAELSYHGFGKGAGKYKNHSCTCSSGHIHQSIFESNYCDDLRILKRAGEVAKVEQQYRVEIYVKGVKVCNHYIDFFVVFTDGRAEFHETKGYETDVWKLKRKLTEILFPDIAYKVIRQKNTFRKGR